MVGYTRQFTDQDNFSRDVGFVLSSLAISNSCLHDENDLHQVHTPLEYLDVKDESTVTQITTSLFSAINTNQYTTEVLSSDQYDLRPQAVQLANSYCGASYGEVTELTLPQYSDTSLHLCEFSTLEYSKTISIDLPTFTCAEGDQDSQTDLWQIEIELLSDRYENGAKVKVSIDTTDNTGNIPAQGSINVVYVNNA